MNRTKSRAFGDSFSDRAVANPHQWWGDTLGVIVLAANLLGDAFRDVLDPRLQT